MSGERGHADAVAEQRALLARLRAVAEAKDAENAVLRAELDAERELRRRLELRLAEMERQLGTATLARWCRIRSYLDSAAAHGVTALDAIARALAGKPWLPPLPATA
jgi:hypothetical protein